MSFGANGVLMGAAALRARGLRFLADDACALDEHGQLWLGPPLLSIQQFGESDEEFAVYDGKSIVAVAGHDVSPRDMGAVMLRPELDEPLGIRPLTGRRAVEAALGEVRAPQGQARPPRTPAVRGGRRPRGRSVS